MEGINDTQGQASPVSTPHLQRETNTGENAKEFVIKFSAQSDIRSWKPALEEFGKELINSGNGKTTAETYLGERILHKTFIAFDEAAALQLLLALGKKYGTSGRIKIVRRDASGETTVFVRSGKAYR